MTATHGTRLVCMLVCSGLFLGPTPARSAQEPQPAAATTPAAGPSEADLARASELYQNGKRLYDEGSYEAAILAFKEGYELSKRYQFLFNLSQAYERMGEFGEAANYLDQFRAFAPEEQAEVYSRKIDALRQRQQEKEQREAELKAQAAEKAKQEQLANQQNQPQQPQPQDDQPPPKQKVFGPAAWALTGTALVGFGLGIGMGIRANNKKDAALGNCYMGDATLCADTASDDLDARRTSAIVSDVGFVIGGVATVGVIVVTALRAKKIKESQRKQALTPYAGPRAAGLLWTTRF